MTAEYYIWNTVARGVLNKYHNLSHLATSLPCSSFMIYDFDNRFIIKTVGNDKSTLILPDKN